MINKEKLVLNFTELFSFYENMMTQASIDLEMSVIFISFSLLIGLYPVLPCVIDFYLTFVT